MSRGLVLSVLALAALAWGGQTEFQPGPAPKPGLIFHATFDNGPKADLGAGWLEMHHSSSYQHNPKHEFRFVEGRLGKAVNLRPGKGDAEYACFKMPGHVCAPVGTLAFWFRTNGSAPSLRLETQSNDFWVMIRLLDVSGRPGSPINVSAVARDYAATPLTLDDKTWGDDKWHHLAVVWDETQGLRGYLDGKEAGSSWGKAPFHRGYLSAGRLAITGADFDDLRVYDAALPVEAIQTLAQGREPAAAPASAQVPVSHRLEALSWDKAPASQFIPVSGPTRIARADISDARALRKSGWRAVDGRHDSAWPLYYHSYAWLSGGNLHLTLQTGARFNFVRAVGRLNQSSLCEGAALERPAAAKALLAFDGERFVRGYPIASECAAPAVSVYKSPSRDKLLNDRRMLNDLALLHVAPGTARDSELAVFHLTPSQPQVLSGASRARLIHWYRPEERNAFAALAQPSAGAIPVPALRYVHVMSSPQPQDTPLSAVRL
ncbi:MAG TPA: LamG domain-containing protein, partial [Candidatus Brocadiia bacterium]|nr:LamG domain-containing protein [Candidatus Brocadiia bacterium]